MRSSLQHARNALARVARRTTLSPRAPAAPAAAAALHSSSSSATQGGAGSGARGAKSLRYVLLLSSLLAAEVARRSFSSDGQTALHNAAATPAEEHDDVFNPPAPPHDSWHKDWDGLESVPPSLDADGRPLHVTRHLLFIRHGQYVLPTPETEHLDPVLTELGREQARLTGKRIAELGYEVAVIHCSSMARARETAELIGESFPGVALRQTDLLREGVPCAHFPEHPTWKPSERDRREDPPRIKAGFQALVQRWRGTLDPERQVRSVDEWEELQREQKVVAAEPAVDGDEIPRAVEQQHPGSSFASSSRGTISDAEACAPLSQVSSLPPRHVHRYELVVCHGNVIRSSVLRALQLPAQAWLRLSVYNTGISHVSIRWNGHVSVQSVGDTGHLTKEQITYH